VIVKSEIVAQSGDAVTEKNADKSPIEPLAEDSPSPKRCNIIEAVGEDNDLSVAKIHKLPE
jgi:hypothetical protein